MSPFVDALVKRQAAEGWSDREMARQIGIGNASWYRIRTGSRGVGTDVMRRVLQRFPEYSHLAMLFFLAPDVSDSNNSVSSEVAPRERTVKEFA